MSHVEPVSGPANRRLDSWKEIAAFFGRDERTVRRWEKERSLPVRRMPGRPRGSVYAFTHELSQWLETPNFPQEEIQGEAAVEKLAAATEEGLPRSDSSDSFFPHSATKDRRRVGRRKGEHGPHRRELRYLALALAILAVIAIVAVARRSLSAGAARKNAAVSRTHPIDPEAEQLYLKGIYYFNKRTPESLNQAVDYFTQSVVRDPLYAEPYVGMANSYNLLREYSLMPPGEAYPRAAAAAKRAIALNDSISGAHSALAFVDFYWYWDIATAEREFKRAIELDPSSKLAHHWYATFLMNLVRFPESIEEIEKAQKIDPGSTSILADKGLILFFAGQQDQAMAQLTQLETTESSFLSLHNYLAYIYLAQGNYREYLAEARKSATLLHDEARLATVVAGEKAFAAEGPRAMLKAILKEQQMQSANGNEPAYYVARTSALLGDKAGALEQLQNSYAKHETQLTQLRIDPTMSTLHNEPRFRELLANVGLPPLP